MMPRVKQKAIILAVLFIAPALDSINGITYSSHYNRWMMLHTIGGFQEENFNLTVILRTLSGYLLQEGNVIAQVRLFYNNTYFRDYWTDNGRIKIENLKAGKDYNLTVYWKNVLVNKTTFRAINVTNEVSIDVICNVSKLQIESLNYRGDMPIGGVKIYVYHNESGNLYEILTGVDGKATTLLPCGTYIIENIYYKLVYEDGFWEEVDVAPEPRHVFKLTCDTCKTVNLRMYNVSFLILSRDGYPMPSDTIIVIKKNLKIACTLSIDSEGKTTDMLLPYGQYLIEGYWKGQMILNDTLTLNMDFYREYRNTYFYKSVTIRFVDDRHRILDGVNITVEYPWGEKESFITNDEGIITLTNVPFGYYKFIWESKGIILTQRRYLNQSDLEITLAFHSLEINLMCKGYNKAPSGLNVSLFVSNTLIKTKIVNNTYICFEKLPEDTYIIRVFWQGVNVASRTMFLNRSLSMDIECEIYMLLLRFVDKEGNPLPYAKVQLSMPNGTKRFFASDVQGNLKLDYLPHGLYEIKVLWKDIIVNKSYIELNRNLLDYTIVASVRDIRIRIVGFFGQPLSGANVEVYMVFHNGSKKFLGQFSSDQNGYVILKQAPILPNVEYVTDINYFGRFFLENVKVSKKEEEIIRMDVAVLILSYPLSIIEVISVLSVAVTVTLALFVIVRKRMEREEIEELFYEPEKLEEIREKGLRLKAFRKILEWDYLTEEREESILDRIKSLILGSENIELEEFE